MRDGWDGITEGDIDTESVLIGVMGEGISGSGGIAIANQGLI
jgi:hypothetical protein